MSLDEAMSADTSRGESYRAAAQAAVAELEEIDSVILSLQARVAKLRARAKTLNSLLDVMQDVVPDAARRPVPWAPTNQAAARNGENGVELPRRRRRREADTADLLADLSVRLTEDRTRTNGHDLTPQDVLRSGLTNGRHAGPVADDLTPVPADVDAWG